MHVYSSQLEWSSGWEFFRPSPTQYFPTSRPTTSPDKQQQSVSAEFVEQSSYLPSNAIEVPKSAIRGKVGLERKKLTHLKKKTRRGWGSNRNKSMTFSILGNNVNGLNSKWESFISVLQYFDGPNCILLQVLKLEFHSDSTKNTSLDITFVS